MGAPPPETFMSTTTMVIQGAGSPAAFLKEVDRILRDNDGSNNMTAGMLSARQFVVINDNTRANPLFDERFEKMRTKLQETVANHRALDIYLSLIKTTSPTGQEIKKIKRKIAEMKARKKK